MPRGRPKISANDASNKNAAKAEKLNGNAGNLGFEAQLFLAADKLRKNLEPSDYKHVALGLIFLKYISNAFESKRAALLAEDAAAAMPDSRKLAMNRARRPCHGAAESVPDRLVTQADPEDGDIGRRRRDEIEANPGFLGRAGARREHDGVRIGGEDALNGRLVIDRKSVV